MSADYEVQFKVRNGRILRRMNELDIPSVADLARRAELSYVMAAKLVSLKLAPRMVDGEWRDGALRIAAVLNAMPDDLWTGRQQYSRMERNTATVYMDEARLEMLVESGVEAADARLTVNKLIAGAGLSDRDVYVLRGRMDGATQEELGDELGVSKAMISVIEQRSIRKMRAASNRAERLSW